MVPKHEGHIFRDMTRKCLNRFYNKRSSQIFLLDSVRLVFLLRYKLPERIDCCGRNGIAEEPGAFEDEGSSDPKQQLCPSPARWPSLILEALAQLEVKRIGTASFA